MKKINAMEIIERLKLGGSLDEDELCSIKESLINPVEDDDVYNLLRSLALGSQPTLENIKILEKYFYSDSDDLLVQASLYALCNYWGLTERYLDRLLFLLKKENWDSLSSSGISSFGAIGKYLHNKKDSKVFKVLIDIYEDEMRMMREKNPSYNEVHLEQSYRALDIMIRGARAQLDHINMKVPDGFDRNIISKAKKLFEQI